MTVSNSWNSLHDFIALPIALRWMPETTTLCVCSVCDVGMVGSLGNHLDPHRLKVSGKDTGPHKINANSRDMSWHDLRKTARNRRSQNLPLS